LTGQKWRHGQGHRHTTLVVDARDRPCVPPRWYGGGPLDRERFAEILHPDAHPPVLPPDGRHQRQRH
jgi:hypothetical protein